MTPLDTFRSPLLPRERRALVDRRAFNERRGELMSVTVDRRETSPRRSGFDRRESAAGHIRNALQVLQEMAGQVVLDAEQKEKVESAVRRLWLAVAEVERRELRG